MLPQIEEKVERLAGLLDQLAPAPKPVRADYPIPARMQEIRTPFVLSNARVFTPNLTTRQVPTYSSPLSVGELSFLAETHLENVLFEDVFQFSIWTPAAGSVARGCTVARTGDMPIDTRSPRGHSGYYQNQSSEKLQTLTGHIGIAGYDHPGKIYASGKDGNFLRGFRWFNSIFAGKPVFIGGCPTYDVVIDHCAFPDSMLIIGYRDAWHEDIVVSHSIMPYASISAQWRKVTFTHNTIVGGRKDLPHWDKMWPATGSVVGSPQYPLLTMPLGDWVWDYNDYYSDTPNPFNGWTFDQWKAYTGFDAHSTFTLTNRLPNRSMVMPVDAGKHLCNIVVFDHLNYGMEPVVSDLPDGRYIAQNAENPDETIWLDVQNGVAVVPTLTTWKPPTGAVQSDAVPLTTKLPGKAIWEIWEA